MKNLIRLVLGALAMGALGFAQQVEPYRIRVNDVLRIQVYEEPKFSCEAVVDKKGILLSRLVWPRKVLGMTMVELQKSLAKSYALALGIPDPKVSVVTCITCPRQISGSDAYNSEGKRPTAPKVKLQ